MSKSTNKTKKPEHFLSYSLIEKILNYSNKIQNSYFSTYCQNSTQRAKVKPNQALFDKT